MCCTGACDTSCQRCSAEGSACVDIDDDEVNITGRQFVDYVNIANLNVFGLAGDDTFNVTTSATSPTIFIDGGDPIGETPGDQINVDAGGLGVALEAGPETDEGGIIVGAHERISFDHIEGVSIANVACALIIGTNADDDITVIARDASTHPLADGVQDFTTSVNGGLTILWIDVNELYIDALAGDDTPIDTDAPVEEAGATVEPTPKRKRNMTIENLRAEYARVIGRETGSSDRRYLLWKMSEAGKGKIPVGPVQKRAPRAKAEMQVLPLGLLLLVLTLCLLAHLAARLLAAG